MKISDVLSPELTRCAFSGRSKKRIIEALSQLLAEHLSTLARIASIMQNDDYRQRLRNCSEDAILYNTVLELERGKNL